MIAAIRLRMTTNDQRFKATQLTTAPPNDRAQKGHPDAPRPCGPPPRQAGEPAAADHPRPRKTTPPASGEDNTPAPPGPRAPGKGGGTTTPRPPRPAGPPPAAGTRPARRPEGNWRLWTASFRIGLAQINPVVGDLWGNSRLIVDWIGRARDQGADIVLFPELALTGYPPEDLVLKPAFVRDNLKQLDVVVEATKGISAVVGFVDEEGDLFNAAAFMHDGELKAVYHKVFLPNYGVFDEQRYFTPGHRCPIFELGGVRIGVSVCEDCWYPAGPMAWEAQHGAELLLNINGSPYHEGKRVPREEMIAGRASDYGCFIAWVNTVGGQDELVFDGNSAIFGPTGKVLARAPSFRGGAAGMRRQPRLGPVSQAAREHPPRSRGAERLELLVTEIEVRARCRPGEAKAQRRTSTRSKAPPRVYTAVVLGTHDYVSKQDFRRW